MLQVNWTIIDTIHLKGNRFVMGMKIKATVDSKLNDSPGIHLLILAVALLDCYMK